MVTRSWKEMARFPMEFLKITESEQWWKSFHKTTVLSKIE